jgi:hypothetical protein
MPEAGTGRRIGIITGDGKALGAGRRGAPFQMWRFVVTGTAETVIRRPHMCHAEIIAILETVAGDLERHEVSPACSGA